MSTFFAEYPSSGGVISLDGLTGALTLVAGPGITLVDNAGAGTITISSTSGGDVTIGPFGSTPNSNGLSISASQVLNMQPADATHPGGISIADWNTFNNKQPAGSYITDLTGDGTATGPGSVAFTLATVNGNVGSFTLANITVNAKGLITAASSTATGNLTDVGTDGIVITGGSGAVIGSGTSIAQHVADTTHNGYLSSADWNTFNGKQAAGNYITALTGDGTASGPGSAAFTLATVNANTGTFASVTVNGKGLVTAATALSGDATTSGAALTLATVNTNTGSFGSSTAIPSFTVNGKGLITAASTNVVIAPAGTLSGTTLASNVVSSSLTSVGTITSGTWNGTTIAIANGGTGQTSKTAAFDALQPMTTGGDIIYGGASGTGTRLANGSSGQVLTSGGGTAAPSWAAVSAGNFAVSAVKTSTYAILTSDNVVLMNVSGGAFTATLPTAVGVTGKIYTIKRVDQTLGTNATIATTSSQTIDGVTTYTLGTQYEQLTVVSDGANWQVTDHSYPQAWVAYTPTFTSLGTATSNSSFWRRVGDSLEVNVFFSTGTATGSTAKVSLPSGLAINTTNMVSGVSRYGQGNQVASNSNLIVLCDTASTTVFEFANFANGTNFTAQSGTGAFANNTDVSFQAKVPISGWSG